MIKQWALRALVGCASVSACGGGSTATPQTTGPAATPTAAPTSTIPSSTTTTTTTTTTIATTTTTTTEAPTTTVPDTKVRALVWESTVDPARVNRTDPIPTFEADGITVRIQVIGYAEVVTAAECDADPGAGSDSCLIVQLAMDVASDFHTSQYSPEGSVSLDAVITPDGKQISPIWAESGYPGTIATILVVTVPGASPGSTLKINTGSNEVGYTTHTFVVPPIEEFLPAPWF